MTSPQKIVIQSKEQDMATKRRRVGFISDGRDSYGVRRSLITLFRAFGHEQVEPTLICLQDGEMMKLAADNGVRAMLCPVGAPPDFGGVRDALANLRFMVSASRKLAASIRDSGVDSIIVRQPFQMSLAARAAYLAKIPGYWLMPNLISGRYPLRLNAIVYDLLLARYGMFAIGNSAYTQGTLLNLFSRSAFSHLGIDPAEFDPATKAAPRGRYGFGDKDAVFGIFARVVPFKGQLEFVQAFAAALPSFPDMRLLICGGPLDSAYAAKLTGEIDRLGLNGAVHLSGPSDDLADPLTSLYAMCDVIVNARLDPEPFGLSVIEGMMMGKPLLVHALGGPAETVIDRADGWHVDDPSPAGFERGIRRAMADRARWPAIGGQAAVHARESFTDVQAARRILAIMDAAEKRR